MFTAAIGGSAIAAPVTNNDSRQTAKICSSSASRLLLQRTHIIEQQKMAIERIETSAMAGATIGSAAFRKQPILEQRSVANILLSTGIFSGLCQ
ncbi:MAG: hypothetical protein WA417_22345 [Stellaceae bacterium]